MAELTLYDVDPAFAVERHETGDVELLVRAGGTAIRINVGREYDRVSALRDNLAEIGADVERDILDAWHDVPDEGDAYISFDRGRYHVSLDGTRVGDYPSQDVAEIELARAMVSSGVFPNAWFVNERGNHDEIDTQVRRWLNPAGDAMVDLPGVQYEPGDRVYSTEMEFTCVVIADWGPAGVEVHTAGDRTIRGHVTDRALLHPVTD